MPAIASLEDLKAAQKDLLEAKDLNELKAVFKKWRSIGWKNVCQRAVGHDRKSRLLIKRYLLLNRRDRSIPKNVK